MNIVDIINKLEELELPNGAKGAIWKKDLLDQITYADNDEFAIIAEKVKNFALAQNNELTVNANIKGDWETFTDIKEIIFELEYHKAKLMLAIKEKNKKAIKEYLADMANELLFIGNSFGLYDETTTPDSADKQTFLKVEFKSDTLDDNSRTNFFNSKRYYE